MRETRVLNYDLLKKMVDSLPEDHFKTLKEKILDRFKIQYNIQEIDDIYLILPLEIYNKERDLLLNEKWIIGDEYIKVPMIFKDTTKGKIGVYTKKK